jgi:GTP-binding protein
MGDHEAPRSDLTGRDLTGPQANEPDEDARERGRLLFAGPCDFLKGVVDLDGLPASDRREVAFAGRSNVGKSSLINALTGRKTLARTSNTPGRTQEINFFTLGPKESVGLYLVDLPGYGFAAAPKPMVARWTRLVNGYLKGRPELRRVFVLIDARHGIKPPDEAVMKDLDAAAVSYQAVLTKTDKITAAELQDRLRETAETLRKHPAAHPDILATSAAKGAGIDRLRAEIAALAA